MQYKRSVRRTHVLGWIYLEDLLFCGRDIPDERWPAYAEDCASFEQSVSLFLVATEHLTYAEMALM
jgi:hypothetical protein